MLNTHARMLRVAGASQKEHVFKLEPAGEPNLLSAKPLKLKHNIIRIIIIITQYNNNNNHIIIIIIIITIIINAYNINNDKTNTTNDKHNTFGTVNGLMSQAAIQTATLSLFCVLVSFLMFSVFLCFTVFWFIRMSRTSSMQQYCSTKQKDS